MPPSELPKDGAHASSRFSEPLKSGTGRLIHGSVRESRYCRQNTPSYVEQNGVVALLLHRVSKRVLACHEATKLTPRCLFDVDHDNNGELP
jgi:hypothetical protein